MSKTRIGSHTVSRLTVHVVWATKYRYHVLTGEVKVQCRELVMQICESEDARVWGMEHGEHHRRHDQGVSGTPSESWESEQGHIYHGGRLRTLVHLKPMHFQCIVV
jgi:hypothetical protein